VTLTGLTVASVPLDPLMMLVSWTIATKVNVENMFVQVAGWAKGVDNARIDELLLADISELAVEGIMIPCQTDDDAEVRVSTRG
jgi:hypothetical protein